MLTIAISLLFGLVAFAALAQIYASVGTGFRSGRLILVGLSRQERAAVKAKPARPAWRPALVAA